MSGKNLYSALVGEECPVCGESMEPGALRWNGVEWEHKADSVHPQAGHHVFNYTEVVDSRMVASRENAYVGTRQNE